MQTVRNVDLEYDYYDHEAPELGYYDYDDEAKKEEWGWESREDFLDDLYP